MDPQDLDADSEELVKTSGLPASALVEVGDDDRLADPELLEAMLRACEGSGLMIQPEVMEIDLPICHDENERPGTEVIEVVQIAAGRYRLVYSPGVVEGLAKDDVIELSDADPTGFTVVSRSGYLCVWFYFKEPGVNRGPEGDRVRAAVEQFGGVCDGGGNTNLVFSVPVSWGFPAVEALFDDLVGRYPGSTWLFGNAAKPSGDSESDPQQILGRVVARLPPALRSCVAVVRKVYRCRNEDAIGQVPPCQMRKRLAAERRRPGAGRPDWSAGFRLLLDSAVDLAGPCEGYATTDGRWATRVLVRL